MNESNEIINKISDFVENIRIGTSKHGTPSDTRRDVASHGILQVIIGMVVIIIKEIHKEGEGNMRTLPDPLHLGERRRKKS